MHIEKNIPETHSPSTSTKKDHQSEDFSIEKHLKDKGDHYDK